MRHILFTLKGCPFPLCDDEAHIRNMLVNAAVMSGSKLLDVSSHKFTPFGVTAVALLAESHISIHTWPEHQSFTMDFYSSLEKMKMLKICERIKKEFDASEYDMRIIRAEK